MREDRFRQHDQGMDKYVDPTADYQMSARDYVLRPGASPGSGAITITLPPVSEARGRFYSIIARDADGTNTITVQDKDDSECWPGDYTMNGKCDRLLAYSDGFAWLIASDLDTYSDTTPAPTTLTPTTLGQGTTLAPTTG